MQLRALLRSAGVEGMPGVRVHPDAAADGTLAIVIEDRPEPGDTVTESRGIRFYLDPRASALVGRSMLDLEGSGFVLRPSGSP